MNKSIMYNHIYPVWLVNFYSPKRYLLHVKKVKTVKKYWYENVDIFKVYFSWTTCISRSRDLVLATSQTLVVCVNCSDDRHLSMCYKMRLSTCVYNFRWEILKDAKTSGKYSHYLIAQLMYFSLHLCLYNLRGLT